MARHPTADDPRFDPAASAAGVGAAGTSGAEGPGTDTTVTARAGAGRTGADRAGADRPGSARPGAGGAPERPRAAGGAGSRAQAAGATLLYGPATPLPDLILAAQFLIDDLRGEGVRIVSLRVNGHTLRLRLEGLELALAISNQPLAMTSFRGLRRPPRAGLEGRAAELMTDLGTVRALRAIQSHRGALAVLLRQRGGDPVSAAGLDARLRTLLDPLIEAGQPALVWWQRNRMLLTAHEFRIAPTGLLGRNGLPVPEHMLAARRVLATPAGANATDPPDPARATPTDRAARARMRSAGHLFRNTTVQGGRLRLPVLPTPARQIDRLRLALGARQGATAACSHPDDRGGDGAGDPDPAVGTPPALLAKRAALGLWFALTLPSAGALQAMLSF